MTRSTKETTWRPHTRSTASSTARQHFCRLLSFEEEEEELMGELQVINAFKVKTIKDLDCSNYSMGDAGRGLSCWSATLTGL